MTDQKYTLAKENVEPSNLSPTRSYNPQTPISSPAQTKNSKAGSSMWDSNNPMRNPPPLPLSPQMLRNTSLKSPSGSPGHPGKLSAGTEVTEVEHQLNKVLETQTNLTTLINGVDTSVKQTQLDLGNLLQRSSNNNSHLKNLLENVAKSNVLDSSQSSISDEKIEELILLIKSLKPDTELKSKLLDTKINGSFIHIEKLISTQQKTNLESFDVIEKNISALLDEKKESQKNFPQLVLEGLDPALKGIREDIESGIKDIGSTASRLQHYIDKNSNEKLILEKIESLTSAVVSSQTESDLSNVERSFDELQTNYHSQRIEFSKLIELINSNQSSLIEQFSTKLSNIDKRFESMDIPKNQSDLMSKLEKIIDLHSESKNELLKEITKFPQFSDNTLIDKIDALEIKLSTGSFELNEKLHKSELEKKDLEIQVKDKEIEELKTKIEGFENTKLLNDEILTLTESKAKLEEKITSLNKTYSQRLEQFNVLSSDFETLNSKISQFQVEKLSSIMGNAALFQISKSSNNINTPSKPKNTTSTRVLSNNSYLTNVQKPSLGTPKGRKTYELQSISDDEKENQEASLG